MQCPLCASELDPNAVVCAKCSATQVTQRTPAGVVVGWVGIVIASIWGMIWLFLIALLALGQSISGFPWPITLIGTLLAAGLLWYSRSTLHTTWVRREK